MTREVLVRGRKFDVERLVEFGAGGGVIERLGVRHPGAVVILPLLEEAGRGLRVVLIRNRRPVPGTVLVELPAGTLERGEDPGVCAGRELVEETGYRAGRIDRLAGFYTTPGLTDEFMHAFVARDLTPVGQALEADEDIEVMPTDADAALGMVERGEIRDAKTMLVLLWAARAGLIGREGSSALG